MPKLSLQENTTFNFAPFAPFALLLHTPKSEAFNPFDQNVVLVVVSKVVACSAPFSDFALKLENMPV